MFDSQATVALKANDLKFKASFAYCSIDAPRARGRASRRAYDQGHFYLQVPKIGAVFMHTTALPYRTCVVSQASRKAQARHGPNRPGDAAQDVQYQSFQDATSSGRWWSAGRFWARLSPSSGRGRWAADALIQNSLYRLWIDFSR